MAKSFKQLPAKPEAAKRISEKDILDFLEQDRSPVDLQTVKEKAAQARERIKVLNARALASREANDITSVTDVATVTNVPEEDIDVRQTFIIGQQYLEQLKDYVHTKRTKGQYEYTQKQALHEALDMLFKGAKIEPRPAHIRQQEESRKQKIRRGIPK
ncbi:hypothetical protein [Hymenobacter sp. BT730]|uniref:hypothetical protein n=1 Tax=Hymenobacter sp. BT730 TaxID=3063332 RepID=UPI0026DFDEDF|nr:hypothetical protein [Hymenobacter sp. BT730]